MIKKAAKYGTAGFVGYEIGDALHEDSKPTILIKESNSTMPKNDRLEESLFDMKILLMVIIAAIFIVVLLLLGFKTYTIIRKRAIKQYKKSLENGVFV